MSGEIPLDIRDMSREDLEKFFLDHGEKKFRGKQVHEWIWNHWCHSFEQMSSLPKNVRHLLSDRFVFRTAALSQVRRSNDGTIKVGFTLFDGNIVEGVLIPADDRFTACISSQAGCALGCRFCATGKLGFARNLTPGEITDQVVHLARLAGQPPEEVKADGPRETISKAMTGTDFIHNLSNIVFMGMGEPFLNYENVIIAMQKLTSPDGFGLSPQRITVSSVGIPKMIRRMADENPKYHFALSLHAASDTKRDHLIPFNARHPLAELVESLKYYHQKTKKRISIEYILFRDINDNKEDARDLAKFCRNFPVKINLMEYNQVEDTGLFRTSPERVKAFAEMMKQYNLVVNVRKSRGADIAAACGQLAGQSQASKNAVTT